MMRFAADPSRGMFLVLWVFLLLPWGIFVIHVSHDYEFNIYNKNNVRPKLKWCFHINCYLIWKSICFNSRTAAGKFNSLSDFYEYLCVCVCVCAGEHFCMMENRKFENYICSLRCRVAGKASKHPHALASGWSTHLWTVWHVNQELVFNLVSIYTERKPTRYRVNIIFV